MTDASREKTFGDYLVIAICPLLIMALVGSAAFFLLEIGYHGQWYGRLQWTLFWFVLAAVLISRVSIEQGSTYANVYGFLLALVTAAQIYRLVGVTLIGWGILAFIWWCTSKLTWDCTLVDDDEDASGEGLLQVAGLEKHDADPAPAEKTDEATAPAPWWKRLFQKSGKKAGKPHAPGSWVIYFSLLALPAFGIGQMFFAENDIVRRDYGFKLLWVYVAAALGLLLATSFLGLRRYLRQRSLPMPASMAGLWMVLGTLLAGAIMAACLLLPRPGESGILSTLVNQAAQEVAQQASKYAVLTGTAAQGEGRRIGSGDGESKEQSTDQGRAEGDDKKKKADVGGTGKEKSPNSKGETKNQSPGQNPTPAPAPSRTEWIADLIKWLIYAAIIGGIAYVLYRQRRDVWEILKAMWAALLEIYWSIFSWKRRPQRVAAAPGEVAQARTVRRFASLTNPFNTGAAQQMSPEDLVTCTFDALQVWAAERGCERLPDETPLEFARKLAAEIPAIGLESRAVALLYTRIAYAEHHPDAGCLEGMAKLWEALETLDWSMPAGSQVTPAVAS
jgi:hypothetical protein